MVRRVFVVDDYSVKRIKGPQYDVIYEDLGLDEVQTLDPETLLEMVAEAELVVNVLLRSDMHQMCCCLLFFTLCIFVFSSTVFHDFFNGTVPDD